MRTICWVTNNLNHFRFPSNQNPTIMQRSYQIAREGLFTLDDVVKSDSLWILERLLESEDEDAIAMISSPEVLHHLSEALGSGTHILYVPAVKCLGVILSTNDHTIIDKALWANTLTKFSELIDSIMSGY